MCPKGVFVGGRDAHRNSFEICRKASNGGDEVLTTIPALWIEFDEWTRIVERLRAICETLEPE